MFEFVDGCLDLDPSSARKRVPSVTLACTLGDPPVITGIIKSGNQCARNGISARLCMSDDEVLLRQAILAETDQVVLDGHGNWNSTLLEPFALESLLGGCRQSFKARVLMLGCCWGGTERYTNVITRCIKEPTVFLGCKKEPWNTHGGRLFPPLLLALAPLVGSSLPETLKAMLREGLHEVIEKSPKTVKTSLEAVEWTAKVLVPATARGS
jgi:hypothetical protein